MKKFFKFVGVFFTVIKKYDDKKEKYVKSGYFWKVFDLILTPVLAVLPGLCAYGTFRLFKGLSFEDAGSVFFVNILKIIGGLILGYLAIGLAFSIITLCIQNAIIDFLQQEVKKQ